MTLTTHVYVILGYFLLYKLSTVDLQSIFITRSAAPLTPLYNSLQPIPLRSIPLRSIPLQPFALQPYPLQPFRLQRILPCCNDASRSGRVITGRTAQMIQEAIPLAVQKFSQFLPKEPATKSANPFENKQTQDGSTSDNGPTNKEDLSGNRAFECSKLLCSEEETLKGPVCACNHKTGNTVSFTNACDLRKHNCRFDTAFNIILNEICPWEFESRTGQNDAGKFNYDDPRYHK